MKARAARLAKVFGIPLLLAGLTAIGLLSGVLDDGIWDALSWLGLGAPLAVIAWHVARSRRRRPGRG